MAVAVAIACQHAAIASAHDFWLEPHDFSPRVGTVLRIALWEGDRLAGEPYAYDPDRIEEFALIGAGARAPVLGKSGSALGVVKLAAAGLQRIGYRSKRARNHLSAGAFERYLLEAGLDRVMQQRAARGDRDRPGVEIFSRCAKSLICTGGACAQESDQPFGFPLELVAVQNPYQLEIGDTLRVRVLYDDQPLSGARVAAVSRRSPASLAFATSNDHGDASFELSEPGAWLITTIQMIRAPEGLDADWESFWASLTFEVLESR